MLHFSDVIPLHIQIKEVIKKEVQTGKYEEKIPSERELMERFSVSRATIREAVKHLVQEQVLEKVQGKGTFIKTQLAVHEWLDALHSFTETVESLGLKPSARLLKSAYLEKHNQATRVLGEGTLFTFDRLRSADQIPIAIERHFYSKHLGERLEQYNLNESTIYGILEQKLDMTLSEAQQIISCVPISKEDGKWLNLEVDTNVLSVERIITGLNGEPIEYYISILHPAYYSLRITTKRHGA